NCFVQENHFILYSFTDRSRFPQDAEIGAGAAFIEVDAMDSMNILCPSYNSSNNNDNKYEQLVIYQVSDLSFMSCELDSRSQIFLVCDSPFARTALSHRIVFRQYSPLPNGFEYQPGRSYYLISTSDGSAEGMNNTRRGLCVTANMRLRIDVRPLSDQSHASHEKGDKLFLLYPFFYPSNNNSLLLEVDTGSGFSTSRIRKVKQEVWTRSGRFKSSADDNTRTKQGVTVMNGLSNESQKFAEKHGFDLMQLEYVRQLAIDGVEGDFSFREIENDSLKSSTDLSKTFVNDPVQPESSDVLPDRDLFHSTSRQAQRWISEEKQNKFSVSRDLHTDQNTATVGSIQDYVVDDISGKIIFSSRIKHTFPSQLLFSLFFHFHLWKEICTSRTDLKSKT
ncbi:unnamed protein product, partial [Thelazia callipaeda]|uniref:Ephrin RBD domain-containing protein n=1 Tax=Thelazia callipaeda TaxID=103827 RepID=A0A0N5CKX2_THECL